MLKSQMQSHKWRTQYIDISFDSSLSPTSIYHGHTYARVQALQNVVGEALHTRQSLPYSISSTTSHAYRSSEDASTSLRFRA